MPRRDGNGPRRARRQEGRDSGNCRRRNAYGQGCGQGQRRGAGRGFGRASARAESASQSSNE